jgi:ribosomal protein L3 glutamine methyltransferase
VNQAVRATSLAIAAAHYAPGVLVDATDVSTGALAVAAMNVLRHDVGDRVRLHEADLFPATDTRYRVIVSNPPYVSDAEMAALPAEYVAEPELGLRGGPKGYEPVERLLRGARERLTPDGCVFVEVGAGAAAFADAYPKLPLVWLEFERGGDGVFALTAEDLEQFLHAG